MPRFNAVRRALFPVSTDRRPIGTVASLRRLRRDDAGRNRHPMPDRTLFERQEAEPKSSPGLTREQVVARILSLNPSATAEFLSGFDDTSLERYLARLSITSQPRGRASRWVRPDDAPAIEWREAS